MTKILAAIIIIIVVVVAILLIRGEEDTWLCDNGQWVKHGYPSAPMPTEPCE